MDFSSLNVIAIIVASIAAFAFSFAWFGPLKMYNHWMKALGRTPPTPEEMPPTAQLFGLTFLSLIVQSVVISAVLAGLYDSASVLQGLATGIVLGVGVTAMPALGHRMFSTQGTTVWAIEVGSDIIVAGIIGAIVAAF